MRPPVGPEETEDVPALTQNDEEQVWDRLKEGAYCIMKENVGGSTQAMKHKK